MKKGKTGTKISLSALMTAAVVLLVTLILVFVLFFFVRLYENSITNNSVTSSEQAARQVVNTVESYVEDMEEYIGYISDNITGAFMLDEEMREEFFDLYMALRSEVVVVSIYDEETGLLSCWSGEQEQKEKSLLLQNFAYWDVADEEEISISKPHVEALLESYYPWVVTIGRSVVSSDGHGYRIYMDIRFSGISSYVDDVGMGQHGYCYIVDMDGTLVYHPQKQLIYAGLKEEETADLKNLEDGSYTISNVIYTVRTLENCNWRVVGVSYVDEMITDKVQSMAGICIVLLLMVLLTAALVGGLFSWVLGRPAKRLTNAMAEFEGDAENFHFEPIEGAASEITTLSESFGHMVVRVQELMEKVRQEEISLRKTELNALQAQINPHFLYNTLDSIAWMCEENRSQEAVEMVNALARLFRISISKGHELIPLEKEVQHAQSYLKIQNYRYKNQFHYEFDVEESCLPYLCNKITLQPIIENAIYHGIDRMVDEGEIRIGVHEEENAILMSVEDNGVGMTAEQCREILLREPGDRSGIGIKNVNDRIRIYFGEEYGLQIFSEPDVGTRVEIRIPKRKEEGEYENK
ncbi:MAG: sensor histidine kinase [Lachnospiraceae bacterium]|nr:sensor histidine kinase [Lachnospiraceae bacterium]